MKRKSKLKAAPIALAAIYAQMPTGLHKVIEIPERHGPIVKRGKGKVKRW
jgi:hypothetical protein